MSRHAISQTSHISFAPRAAGIAGVLAATLLLADLASGATPPVAAGNTHERAPQAIRRGTL